jgi:3-oxoacyl-[acyl-carrier protein] reductase
MHLHLTNKVALITGVSRQAGIGAAIARQLAHAGATIFTTYYRPYDVEIALSKGDQEAEQLLAELRHNGTNAAGLEIDLADPAAPALIFDAAERTFGHVDILVNNATRDTPANIDTITAATLDQHYAVNIRGPLLLCHKFVQRFQGGEGGRIINLTSGQGVTPMPESLPYVASKGAIEALTFSLAPPLMQRGITINAVDPGATDSGWMDAELRAQLAAEAPARRVGLPEDAARLITFLASGEAGWITGQILRSRGGA